MHAFPWFHQEMIVLWLASREYKHSSGGGGDELMTDKNSAHEWETTTNFSLTPLVMRTTSRSTNVYMHMLRTSRTSTVLE